MANAPPPLTLVQAADIAEDPQASSVGGVHVTSGLPGWYALDIFGPAGSPVYAPEKAQVTRVSGHDPSEGVVGAGGVFGYSVYLHGEQSGNDYFLTHFNDYTVQVGQEVQPQAVIGHEGAHPTTADHIHWAIHGGDPSGVLMADAQRILAQGGTSGGGGPIIPGGLPGQTTCDAIVAAYNNGGYGPIGTAAYVKALAAWTAAGCGSSAAFHDAVAKGATTGTGSADAGPLGLGGLPTETANAAKGIASAVLNPIDQIVKAIQFIFSYRGLEVFGGGLLILIGLSALAKSLTNTSIPVVSKLPGAG